LLEVRARYGHGTWRPAKPIPAPNTGLDPILISLYETQKPVHPAGGRTEALRDWLAIV